MTMSFARLCTCHRPSARRKAVKASISTPVLPVVFTVVSIYNSSLALSLNSTFTPVNGADDTWESSLTCFGDHDSRNLRYGKHISLADLPFLDANQRIRAYEP